MPPSLAGIGTLDKVRSCGLIEDQFRVAHLSAIAEEHTRADEVERHPCPRCAVAAGSPCRSRSDAVAGSALTQELQAQLAAHGIGREKISTRVKVPPRFEAALTLARHIKAHAPHCRVVLTVFEMKRLGRDAAELTALAETEREAIRESTLEGIYRALAECERTQAYPEAAEAADADFALLQRVPVVMKKFPTKYRPTCGNGRV
ncbi:hypothetical protein AB0L53_57850 [Nonomuraea sp. NPDC052129]|uniref:zinc finger domain-containing protein n=1 Tax=Nonomuraea sp. NPDC052129 TaxID=3154651 RepID=UPI00342F1A09